MDTGALWVVAPEGRQHQRRTRHPATPTWFFLCALSGEASRRGEFGHTVRTRSASLPQHSRPPCRTARRLQLRMPALPATIEVICVPAISFRGEGADLAMYHRTRLTMGFCHRRCRSRMGLRGHKSTPTRAGCVTAEHPMQDSRGK